jgi:uncharacterized protein (DUF433 family)
MKAPRKQPESPRATAVSPLQAAYITEVSRKIVDQAIDRGEVMTITLHEPDDSSRRIGYTELIYLRLRAETGDLLSLIGKRRLYEELRRAGAENPKLEKVEFGLMTVAVDTAVSWVRRGLARVRRAERYVSVRTDVRAGEPVVRGTRVPVYVLADLAVQGADREELLQDYPAVTPLALDAALLYARLNPRRGPRRAAPWHPESSAEA